MVDKTIALSDALNYLNTSSEKPYFFINPGGELETFFTYKGRLVDLNKLKISSSLKHTPTNEVKEEIRVNIISSAKFGEWLIFNIDKNSTLNIKQYMDSLGFDFDSLINPKNFHLRDYYVKHNLLLESEDKDNFGNKGYWNPQETYSISFLASCSEEDIKELKTNNEGQFEFILVK